VSHITTDSTDITPSTLSATIVPGNVNTTFSISNLDDTVEKTDNREYRVTITGVDSTDNGGYESITFDPSNNATRIIDNDTAGGAEVYLSLGNSSVDESQSMMGFNFFIEQAISSDITFNYATADNNATAGSDYESSSGLATITAGETVVVVFVPLLDDTIQEGNETFYLNISNVSANALAEISQSVGTIVDND
jgi:hypothetical protein